MTTFVLVHGAFYGGYCWRRVARALRAAGHDVYTPTLTGLGERAHLGAPTIGLRTHIDDVASVLTCEDLSSVVLVGHSYGGMVITGAAERVPERIAQLVFLDAHIPEDGKSDFDLLGDATRAALEGAAGGTGFVPAFPVAIMGVTDPADQAWVEPRRSPQPLATFAEPLSLASPAAAKIPRSYIACTQNEALVKAFGGNPVGMFWERARREGWPMREIDAPHDAMIAAPAALTEALLSLVQ